MKPWVKFLVVSGELEDIPDYLSVDDDLNVISCDMSGFYDEDGGGQIELLYGFISICANAFEPGESTETVLTSLVIPQTVSAIGDYAFSGNKSLEMVDIELGTDFHELGHGVVSACESLNEFTVLSAS